MFIYICAYVYVYIGIYTRLCDICISDDERVYLGWPTPCCFYFIYLSQGVLKTKYSLIYPFI